jgi:ribosomal protein S12 methylthiotransferase accessory factor
VTPTAPASMRNRQLERLLDLVGPRISVIRSLTRRPRSDDEPSQAVVYDAVLADYDFRRGESVERGACGKALTEDAAKLGAIGEAIEHYCACHAARKRMRRAVKAQLDDSVISPVDLVLFSDAQYASADFLYKPWDPASPTLWMPAIDLSTRERCWAPATLVYLNFSGEQPHDFFCPPTSSGLAAGPTTTHAVRRALLELVEREAFLVAWLHQLPLAEIDSHDLSGADRGIWEIFARGGTDIRFFSLPTDLPAWPVMALALSADKSMPAAVVGLGCDTALDRAVRGALLEICQMFEPLRRKYEKGTADALDAYRDVRTLEQHAAYFFRRDHLNEFEFLWRDGRRLRIAEADDFSAESPARECDRLVDALATSGCRAAYAELTTPDLDEYPIRVVRAMVTDMQPIHFGHQNARLGGRRLFELPVSLGYANQPLAETALNPCPHPLA